MITLYGWLVPTINTGDNDLMHIELYFSSRKRFNELWSGSTGNEILIPCRLPDHEIKYDFIPDNY